MVKGHGKNDESSMASKNGPGKFIAAKVRTAHASLSQQSNPTLGQVSSLCTDGKMTERDIQVGAKGQAQNVSVSEQVRFLFQSELDKILQTLNLLKEKNPPGLSNAVQTRIAAIQNAFKDPTTNPAAIGNNNSVVNDPDIKANGNNGSVNNPVPGPANGKRVSIHHVGNGQVNNCDNAATGGIVGTGALGGMGSAFGGLSGALVVAETATLAAAAVSSNPEETLPEPTPKAPTCSHPPNPFAARAKESPPPTERDSREEADSHNISPSASSVKRRPRRESDRRPSSCVSSCRSSRYSASECSLCNATSGSEGYEAEEGADQSSGRVVSSCSMGSDCIYQRRRRRRQRRRKQQQQTASDKVSLRSKRSMNIQTDLSHAALNESVTDIKRTSVVGNNDGCDSVLDEDEVNGDEEDAENTDVLEDELENDGDLARYQGQGQGHVHVMRSCGGSTMVSGEDSSSSATPRPARVRSERGPPPPIPKRQKRVRVGEGAVTSSGGVASEDGGGGASSDDHDTRSGHERTHRIVINLDDKNRFTDEVTV